MAIHVTVTIGRPGIAGPQLPLGSEVPHLQDRAEFIRHPAVVARPARDK
jgi:hypothetical protein